MAKIEKASEDPESAVNQSGEWCVLLVGKGKGLHLRACIRECLHDAVGVHTHCDAVGVLRYSVPF